MKILTGAVSGPKSLPSLLYNQEMMGFCIALTTPTNQPITNYRNSVRNSVSDQPTFLDVQDSFRVSSLQGQFLLNLSTCWFDSANTSYNSTGGFQTIFDDSSSLENKLYAGSLLNVAANSTINYQVSHTTSGQHDHTNLLCAFHSTELITFDYPSNIDLISVTGSQFSSDLIVPIPAASTANSYLISVVIHKFYLETPQGWSRIITSKIDGTAQGVTGYLREHQISLFTRQLTGTVPTSVNFKVVGS